MQGKTILITGATDGIGKASALKLARDGAAILVHGRSEPRCRQAMAEIAAEAPGATLRHYVADFRDLASVFRMIDAVRTAEPKLDVLINNAGIAIEDVRVPTADGHEQALQVNYLSTYALSMGLAPLLGTTGAPRGRVVCVSSSSQATIDFDDPDYERDWNAIEAYGRSKWAQACLAAALAEPLQAEGVNINAVHPGAFMPTKLVLGRFPVVDSIAKGVESICNLAANPLLESTSGQYFDGIAPAQALSSVYDAGIQGRLVALSEEMLRGVAATPSWEALRARARETALA